MFEQSPSCFSLAVGTWAGTQGAERGQLRQLATESSTTTCNDVPTTSFARMSRTVAALMSGARRMDWLVLLVSARQGPPVTQEKARPRSNEQLQLDLHQSPVRALGRTFAAYT